MSVNAAALSQFWPWKNLLQANIPFSKKEKPPLLLLIPLPSSYALPICSFPTLSSRRKFHLVPPARLFPASFAPIAPAAAPATLRTSTPCRQICRFGPRNSELLLLFLFLLRTVFTFLIFRVTFPNFPVFN